MSDNANTETKPAGKAPSHVVYQVRDRGKARRVSGPASGPPGHTPMARASTSSSKPFRWTAASALRVASEKKE